MIGITRGCPLPVEMVRSALRSVFVRFGLHVTCTAFSPAGPFGGSTTQSACKVFINVNSAARNEETDAVQGTGDINVMVLRSDLSADMKVSIASEFSIISRGERETVSCAVAVLDVSAVAITVTL